ncbi:hypothetical protein [Spirosoma sordidisoli]|uniref:Aerotolerance regulator N-terminal domain-containing protein n=1 Tax=Spirosoma sordidisoli TaxID=2502893 RepID=A0A4Q2UMN9_9BACT|nr:hypothetical protein [Spirosoma sordidisoli]RYC70907.1 hypothetical protein EQG79_01775 [Spirosoma sordidisoli]
MHTTLPVTNPFVIATLLALLVMLVVQMGLLFRNKSLPPGRKWLRAGLNGLLWLLAVAFVLQPTWPSAQPTSHALLVGDDVPGAFAQHVRDSLHLKASFTSARFKPRYDSVTLVGQDFPTETLTSLSQAALRWVPYNAPDQARDLHWKAVVGQGELQRITGRINSSGKQRLTVRYGNQTLDSLMLPAGETPFSLRFPAFARGRSRVELVLKGNSIDSVHFFSRPLKPLRVQFLQDSPDFESKTLADWLGRHGHSVQLTATLSKNISSDVRINATSSTAPADLIVTDPSNAGSAAVRKAAADGRAVLFINLTNPEADCRTINQALGSRWQVRRIATEPTVPVSDGLTALPYRFAEAVNQSSAAVYPVAAQRITARGASAQSPPARVAASLLSDTFPLALSGDSLTYTRIWTAILALTYPTNETQLQADAPLIRGIAEPVQLNNTSRLLSALLAGPDTVRLATAPLNNRSVQGDYRPTVAGWQPVSDSLALFVREPVPGDPVGSRARVRQLMLAHADSSAGAGANSPTTSETIPSWVWLAAFILVLGILWVEPKQ